MVVIRTMIVSGVVAVIRVQQPALKMQDDIDCPGNAEKYSTGTGFIPHLLIVS